MTKYLLEDHIYRIPTPIPFPMKYIYCYLVKGENGWTLIDTGFNYEPARQFWQEVFDELAIQLQEITMIYLTHYHPDHFGLAGWMQELTGAPVYIGSVEYERVAATWGSGSTHLDDLRTMCLNNGVPQELTEQIIFQLGKMKTHVTPMPELSVITTPTIPIGDREWQVIHTPGHSDGHLCFYEPISKRLLAGDHILDKITPNISLWPGFNPNPLQDYLDSLKKIATLNIERTFPAHGKVIEDVYKRIEELLIHHDQRLSYMADLVKQARTAYEVADEAFNHRKLNPHQWRFALSETVAHLEYLRLAGQIEKREEADLVYYHR